MQREVEVEEETEENNEAEERT